MDTSRISRNLDALKERYPEKFASEAVAFARIRRGDRIFIGTACGEPQHLVRSLVQYVESNPGAFYDAEVLHVWTLGVAPYTKEKFKRNFRHNSFFVGNDTRGAVNKGAADYIDWTREVVILAVVEGEDRETAVGIGQYGMAPDMHTAEVAFVVRDEWQQKGVGLELLGYLTLLARRQGLLGFTAEVLMENAPMLRLFAKMGFDISRRSESGVWELQMAFRG